jgi:hypothetical protein
MTATYMSRRFLRILSALVLSAAIAMLAPAPASAGTVSYTISVAGDGFAVQPFEVGFGAGGFLVGGDQHLLSRGEINQDPVGSTFWATSWYLAPPPPPPGVDVASTADPNFDQFTLTGLRLINESTAFTYILSGVGPLDTYNSWFIPNAIVLTIPHADYGQVSTSVWAYQSDIVPSGKVSPSAVTLTLNIGAAPEPAMLPCIGAAMVGLLFVLRRR